MNLSELDVFGNGQQGSNENESSESNTDETGFDDFDCPIIGVIEDMYLEPHPYGVTLSISGTERILEKIGYRIVEKGGERYALKGSEKLSRNKSKRESQKTLEVYRKEAENLAIERFIKDWENVFGTTGNS